jgi:hypothetical protein
MFFFFVKRSLYPQLTSIYDCVSKDDHETIRQILSTPTMNEKRAICNWILPRGKRPNRSHAETKVNFNKKKKFFFLINHFHLVNAVNWSLFLS